MKTLRIATWNVEYSLGAQTNARRLRVLHRHPADIWVLIETRDTLKPLGGFRAAHGQHRPFYGSSVKHRSRWVSIWSRHPIVARPWVRGMDRERTTSALIRTPLGEILVFGTVMPWKDDKGRCGMDVEARGWSRHHAIIPEQIAKCRDLARRYPDAMLCVAGDFNTDLGTGAYYGTQQGIGLLRDGFQRLRLVCPTAPEHFKRRTLEHPPIDHIALSAALSKRVRVCAAWEGRVGAPRLSDHSGICVSISSP